MATLFYSLLRFEPLKKNWPRFQLRLLAFYTHLTVGKDVVPLYLFDIFVEMIVDAV